VTDPGNELTAIALQARTGDSVAFSALVKRTQGEMWRFVAKMTDSTRADDVTQDVYLRIWRALPSFSGESSARTWMYSVARHVIADHVRLTTRRRRVLLRFGMEQSSLSPLEADVTAQPYAVADLSSSTALEEFIRALSFDYRTAFVMTQLLGFSYAEAANMCEVPIGTIRSRVARARDALISALAAAEAV
jgi:RNA polymerase sigma-70 factor, ECF subfamily